MTLLQPAAGTDEARWAGWVAPSTWPVLDVGALAARTVLVLAAHPDDEALGVGGLLGLLARAGARPRLVWASDGEASHPGSTADLVPRMAAVRRAEARRAMAALGLARAPREHLGLPDGRLAAREPELVALLTERAAAGDVVLAPWTGDGHPDHEACGRAAVRAARRTGATVLEYPVWAWHWAAPGDPRVPWGRCHRVDLDAAARERKAAALAAFRSQIEPIGPEQADAAVLPDRVLAHFRRPYEVVLEHE